MSQSPTLQENFYHQELEPEEEAPRTPGPITRSLSSSIQGSGTPTPITRTVAIIKNHALQYRFDIEPRIQQANFEIVKERQMEFDTETDPDYLYELFGEDADSLAEGPVWVYVLERRRAVEVWNALMGDRDPEAARRDAPNSLRALYGISREHNGFMGSPDLETAEIQIASLFASSPPFPTTELPDTGYSAMTESVLAELAAMGTSDSGYAASSVTNVSTVNGSQRSAGSGSGAKQFRARPLPATTLKPDIVPRMSRAAALRTGMAVDKTSSAPRVPLTKERLAQTFANVPGHKRSETIAVASTAAPTIAPRMTRAASLRLGQSPVTSPVRRKASAEGGEGKSTFEGVPGHKRRESIAVASTKAPTVAPRMNKSAAMRLQKDKEGAVPPTSFRTHSGSKAPSLSRTASRESAGSQRPPSQTSARPSMTSRPASQATVSRPTPAPRASSVASTRPRQSLAPKLANEAKAETKRPESRSAPTPTPKLRPRPSSIGAPTIAPKMNKSAALRAAKMEAENAAAAAAAAKKATRPKAPPSSFKSIAT